MNTHHSLRLAPGIALAGFLAVVTQAATVQALATYGATATGTLTITGLDHADGGNGVLIDGQVFSNKTTTATGSAVAEGSRTVNVIAAEPMNMIVGDSVYQTSSVLGSASMPDRAESDITTDGDLTIENISAFDATLHLEFAYEIHAEAAVTLDEEWALGDASVDVFSGVDELVDIFFDEVFVDTDQSQEPWTVADTVPFELTVPAGQTDILTSFVDTYGVTGLQLGDVNLDGVVNGLDVAPFVGTLTDGKFQHEADMNRDGEVNGLDVDPFVEAVLGSGVQGVPEPATVILVFAGLAVCAGSRIGRR